MWHSVIVFCWRATIALSVSSVLSIGVQKRVGYNGQSLGAFFSCCFLRVEMGLIGNDIFVSLVFQTENVVVTCSLL